MSEGSGIEIDMLNDILTIRIPVATLVFAFENDPKNEQFSEATQEVKGPKITNRDGFIADVIARLEGEDEDGTTPVHVMLDTAMREAVEWGSEHVTCNGE